MASMIDFFFMENKYITFPWQFKKASVLHCKLQGEYLELLDTIRTWAIEQQPSATSSHHWWHVHGNDSTKNLPIDIQYAFTRIALSPQIMNMFHDRHGLHSIDVLYEMNELYISPPADVHNTSDKVFYTKHIDGPYYYFPFASCYRMIVGMDDNKNIQTCFHMIPYAITAKRGDVVAFDFHRECHYIQNIQKQDSLRVVLKIHYCVYPKYPKCIAKFARYLGRLSVHYNQNFRSLFLYTIQPTTFWEHTVAHFVILGTKVVHSIEAYIGYSNIAYICFMMLLGCLNYSIFVYGTSCIHYIRYMATRYYKTKHQYAHGHYLRDMVLYKIISDVHLITSYPLENGSISEMLTILQGYIMSTMYLIFDNVDADMYIIYHIVALIGLYQHMPYLVNMHWIFYVLNLVQRLLI